MKRIVLVGGFLGAGKTTFLSAAAKLLAERGIRAGLVSNDQAPDLVDTAVLKRSGSPVAEVSGSCFCCNFKGLVGALDSLDAEVALAEPVGSCTDLSATILQPLKDGLGGTATVAPLSVLVAPERLAGILGGGDGGLHPSSAYIFRKQLEEADFILLSKCDLESAERTEALAGELRARYPQARVFATSAVRGDGMEAWMDAVLSDGLAGTHLAEVDYDVYAQGEAVLGWLNASAELAGAPDWNPFLARLMRRLGTGISARKWNVGHVKAALEAGGALAWANWTGGEAEPEFHGRLSAVPSARLTLNARVQCSPEELETFVREMLEDGCGEGVSARIGALRCLSPGRPNPTHRYERVVEG